MREIDGFLDWQWQVRRERISERMKYLQGLVPGCSKITGKAGMLEEIINYVQSLQRQVEVCIFHTYLSSLVLARRHVSNLSQYLPAVLVHEACCSESKDGLQHGSLDH